jgi:chorismate mutase
MIKTTKMEATIAATSMKEVTNNAWKKRPLIISGPCSAETEEQVLATATQ